MLAHNRRTRVNGRIIVEIISIQKRTRPRPTGDPVGTKWVKNEILPRQKKRRILTLKKEVLNKILNQPCLLLANEKGIKPLKLIKSNKANNE